MKTKTIHDRLEHIIASAGTRSRHETLVAFKSFQDEAMQTLAIAEDAFNGEQGDIFEGSRIVGYDIAGRYAPALLIQKGRCPELILPVSVEKAAGGKQRVVFQPLIQGPTYTPVKKNTAAASKGTNRITTTPHDSAEAATAPQDPFWVELESAEATRKRQLADAARRGQATVTHGPGGISVAVPSDQAIARAKARTKANLDKVTASTKVDRDRWGAPI